ncbi:MAG: hypothetical protein ABMB14_06145 [Myxococcota bacterium]
MALAAGRTAWAFTNDSDEGHNSATATIDFLRGGVYTQIRLQHEHQDRPWSDADADQRRHAMYCMLPEMSGYIHEEYDAAIAFLDPTDPDVFASARAFGRLLHPIQDFYSHSNWVELLEERQGPWAYVDPVNLIDGGTGPFRGLEPLSWVRDDIVVGTVPPGGLPAGFVPAQDPYSPIPTLTVSGWDTYRVLTSAWGASGECLDVRDGLIDDQYGDGPRTRRMVHGTNGQGDDDDPCLDGYPTAVCMNKDDPGRPLYGEAVTMAGWQTEAEWCRLLNLTAGSTFGYAAASELMTLWADPSTPPHPAATSCAPATPGAVELTVTIDDLDTHLSSWEYPTADVLGTTFVAASYTGDFGQSAATQGATTVAGRALSLCVDPTDIVLATVWGWQDIRTGIGGGAGRLDETDRVLPGTTLTIDPSAGPGTFVTTSGDVDVTYRVTIDETNQDADYLSACAEAFHHTSDTDEDTDDDGLWDDTEVILGTDPTRFDTDGDGLGDLYEVWNYSTDPLDPDTDDDCAPDGVEVWYGLDPREPDIDGDGWTDGAELDAGTDPLVWDHSRDKPVSSCVDEWLYEDLDDDALPDWLEEPLGTDVKQFDTDGDKVADGMDPSWSRTVVDAAGCVDGSVTVLLDEAAEKVVTGMFADALDRVEDVRSALALAGCKPSSELALAQLALDRLATNLAESAAPPVK